MKLNKLQKLVFTALDNAVENGYDPLKQSVEANTTELIDQDSEISEYVHKLDNEFGESPREQEVHNAVLLWISRRSK